MAMQQEIGAFDAKTRLSELLARVEQGNSYLITRRGKPVARLVPVEDDEKTRRFQTMTSQIREERARYNVSAKEISALRKEGRKR
jgi:prevent-host-death family protein